MGHGYVHSAAPSGMLLRMSEQNGEKVFEEWRVHGHPDAACPPYDFVWSLQRNPHLGDPEEAARSFFENLRTWAQWEEGPTLSRRVVRISDWESVEQLRPTVQVGQ